MTDLLRLAELIRILEEVEKKRAVLGEKIETLIEKDDALKAEGLVVLREIESIQRVKRRDLESPSGSTPGYGGATKPVIATLESDPTRIWTNAEVARAMYKNPSRPRCMRVNSTLVRLAREGRVRKLGHGKYQTLKN